VAAFLGAQLQSDSVAQRQKLFSLKLNQMSPSMPAKEMLVWQFPTMENLEVSKQI
jgi:hypothetical protein